MRGGDLDLVVRRRWLLPEHHAPLSAPIDGRHSHKLNFYLGIGLVVFMAVSVVALVCCCYHLEWRLRLQSRNAARSVNRANGSVVGQSHDMSPENKVAKQETNISVMMPGDSIPSFLANAKPYGSVPGADVAGFPAAGEKLAPQILNR